jgi:membrane protein YdbS with pleckstrin-like domain
MMTHIDDNLKPGESLLFTARTHPAIFIPSLFSFFVTLAVCMLAFHFAGNQDQTGSTSSTASSFFIAFLCLSGILFLYSILLGIQALMITLTTEFAVTCMRLVARTGFLRKHTLDVPLKEIKSVEFRQGVLGRVLNYGTLTITEASGNHARFRAIADPLAVCSRMNQVIEKNTRTGASQEGTPTARLENGHDPG